VSRAFSNVSPLPHSKFWPIFDNMVHGTWSVMSALFTNYTV